MVYIVLSHKHSLRQDPKTGKGLKDQWEVSETVEFVNQLKNKHSMTSSAVGDYINRKMLSGSRVGMGDYDQFEGYVRKKYAKQMAELDARYRTEQVPASSKDSNTITDAFGNVREKTVFDV